MTLTPRRVLAAVLATAAGAAVAVAVPAQAHNPRNTPPGAPRMDLEVMVTPEIEGRITPGGTDPIVSVDGFGNRFVVASKEDAQRVVGLDGRSGRLSRSSAWAWTSEDDGLTWANLEVAPAGAEQLVPQGVSRDITSAGPMTLIAENLGATTLIYAIRAAGRGRLGSALVLSTTQLPGAVGGDVSVATNGTDSVIAAAPQDGPTLVNRVVGDSVLVAGGVPLPGRCDIAADPRAKAKAFWAACLDGGSVVLHQSRDAGATFTRRTSFAAAAGALRPQVDVGPDGTPYVLSGLRLTRLVGSRPVTQNLQVLGGDHRGAAFAVSAKGRVAVTAYRRAKAGATWTVLVALFTPGTRPSWYDFADHDPAAPAGASEPPSAATSVDTDPLGRLQMVWVNSFLHAAPADRPLLRNVFTARSVTS